MIEQSIALCCFRGLLSSHSLFSSTLYERWVFVALAVGFSSMFDLQSIIWLTCIAIFIYYWRGALLVKDRAYHAAQKRCEEMQVQLLDENVYLRRLWFKRNDSGRLLLWRAFYFEFTVSGADRYFGRVIMLGSRITQVELDAHRVH